MRPLPAEAALLGLLLAGLGGGGVAHAAPASWGDLPEDAVALRGVVRQEVLPELQRRQATARARTEALAAVERGRSTLAEAAPALDAAELGSVAAVEARLLALDRRGVARAEERRADLPELADARLLRAVQGAWAAALQAEEAADDAERRVLYALQGWLVRSPRWWAEAVRTARGPVDEAHAEVVASLEGAEGEAKAELLVRLALLDEARTRWTVLRRAARDAAVAARPLEVDVGPELAHLAQADVVVAADARRRLDAVLPELAPAPAEAARQAVVTWLQGPALAARQAALEAVSLPEAADAAAAQVQVEAATAALARAQAARTALGAPVEGEEGVRGAERALADVDLQIAERRLELARAHVAHLSEAEAAAVAAADEARLAAERARAATGDHPAVTMRTESREWSAEAYAAVQALSAELDRVRDERRAALAALNTRTRAILAAAAEGRALGPGTSTDETYALVRTWISQLRSSLLASVEELVPEGLELPARPDPAPRMAQLQAWTGQAQAMPDDTLRAELLPLLADTRDAIDAEVVPLDGARDRLAQARSDRLEDLRLVKELKHRLRPSVSQAERGVDWATFGTDFVAELRLLGVQGLALLRERVRWLVAAPAMLVDMNRVGGATRRLVWSLVLLVVWLVLRRRAEVFADRCLDGAERLGVPLPRRARELLRPRVADVLLPVIDGSVAALLAPTAAALAPELGIVLRALAWSAVFGALRASVKVLFAQAGELRPALLLVDEEELALGQQTWTTLGVWWVAGYVLEHVLSELMFADAVGDFVALVIDLVGLVLVVVLAVRWEPRLLARVRRLGRAPAWLRRVIARTRVGPLAPVRAVVLGGYLGAAIVWDVLQGTAAQQDGYSALVAVMDRVRFGGEAEDGAAEAPSVLEPEVVARLTSGEVPPEVLVARPKAEAAVVDQLEGWRRDRRRGVLVLTGDRGDGKGVLLDRIAEHLVVDDLPARRGTLEGRLTSAKAVRGWIAGFTGLAEVPEDDDALVEALLALPSCVHVIRRTQRTFLRHVGGFEGLRTLLYVCNATSERHFWILGVHRPAWGYLSRIATLVNAGVVRAVVDVAPLSGPDLRELVLRRSQHAGIDVDFRRLENTGPFGAPPDVERERAIQSYFRLLAEASGGCPTIALELWARSLRPRPDGHADVVVVPELAGRKLADVGLLQLFVLAALRIQEDLTVAELSQVIDADEVDVRADVRELVQRGVLAYDGGRARVETLWLRGVTTVLRRRHILQWAA